MKTADIELSAIALKETSPETHPAQRQFIRAQQEYEALADKMQHPADAVPDDAILKHEFKAGTFSGDQWAGLPDPMIDLVHQVVNRIGQAVDWNLGYARVGGNEVLFATLA